MMRHSISSVSTRRLPTRRLTARRLSTRRGAVLICVLGCIATILVVGAMAAQFALRARIEARTQRSWLQAQLFAEAGVIRAVDQLRSNSEYKGEAWTPDFQGTSQFESASIAIEVRSEPDGEQSLETNQKFDIQVVAKIFNKNVPERAVQSTLSLQINQNQLSKKETGS